MKNKKYLIIIFTLLTSFFLCNISYASEDLNVYSEAAILMDSSTGKILAGKNQLKKMIKEIVLFHFPIIGYVTFSRVKL